MFLVWKLLFLEAWLLVDWPDAVVKSDAVVISLDRNWLELVLETEAWCAACFSFLSCCFFSIRVLIPAIFLEEKQVLGAASEGGGLIWVLFIVMDCGNQKEMARALRRSTLTWRDSSLIRHLLMSKIHPEIHFMTDPLRHSSWAIEDSYWHVSNFNCVQSRTLDFDEDSRKTLIDTWP